MRESSFGERKNSIFDRLFFLLRSRVIVSRLKKVRDPKTILDLGCGYNAYFLSNITALLPSIQEAVGMDMSVNERLGSKKITLVPGNLNKKLPFPDQKFDVVFSTAVLEHLNDWDYALREMHRVLKKGGYLFLTTPAPSAKPVLEFLAYTLKLIDEKEIRDHKKYFSRKELKKLFSDLGYARIRVAPFQFGLNTIAVCKK